MFTNKQSRAAQRQSSIQRPLETTALKDNVLSSPDLDELELPAGRVPQTLNLPAEEASEPLSNSLRPLDVNKKPSREASTKAQSTVNMEEVYLRWSTFEEQDGLDATALYSEYGEALKRYEGDGE